MTFDNYTLLTLVFIEAQVMEDATPPEEELCLWTEPWQQQLVQRVTKSVLTTQSMAPVSVEQRTEIKRLVGLLGSGAISRILLEPTLLEGWRERGCFVSATIATGAVLSGYCQPDSGTAEEWFGLWCQHHVGALLDILQPREKTLPERYNWQEDGNVIYLHLWPANENDAPAKITKIPLEDQLPRHYLEMIVDWFDALPRIAA